MEKVNASGDQTENRYKQVSAPASGTHEQSEYISKTEQKQNDILKMDNDILLRSRKPARMTMNASLF